VNATVTDEEMAEILARAPFARAYGFELLSASDGTCSLAVPFAVEHERPGGLLAGVVFMAAADVAFWLAVISRLGREGEMAVTSDLGTAFLGAARGQGFRCQATVLKLGRRLVYGTAECRDPDGRLLTHHTITYVRPAAA
jgi:uncharacterized protein (TIGR00369 family)